MPLTPLVPPFYIYLNLHLELLPHNLMFTGRPEMHLPGPILHILIINYSSETSFILVHVVVMFFQQVFEFQFNCRGVEGEMQEMRGDGREGENGADVQLED